MSNPPSVPTVVFPYSPADDRALSNWHLRRHPADAILTGVLLLWCFWLPTVGLGAVTGSLWIAAAITSLVAGYFYLYTRKDAARRDKEAAEEPDFVQVRLEPEGLTYRREQLTHWFDWTQVTGLSRTRTHFFIGTADRQAFPVPLRAFKSGEDAERFQAALLEHRDTARPASPGPRAEEGTSALSVEFELSAKDLRFLGSQSQRGSCGSRNLGLASVLITLLALWRWGWNPGALLCLPFLGFFLLLHGAWLFAVALALRRPTFTGKRTLRASSQGLRESYANSAREVSWAAVKSIEDRGGFLNFELSPRGEIHIPRRAFPSQAEADAFFIQCRQWHQQASASPD